MCLSTGCLPGTVTVSGALKSTKHAGKWREGQKIRQSTWLMWPQLVASTFRGTAELCSVWFPLYAAGLALAGTVPDARHSIRQQQVFCLLVLTVTQLLPESKPEGFPLGPVMFASLAVAPLCPPLPQVFTVPLHLLPGTQQHCS